MQRKLAEAYYKEVKRHPERALNIYIQPHSLPVGAERAASAKLVAERTDEERAAVQAKNTLSKAGVALQIENSPVVLSLGTGQAP